jgi:hypothetical protein
MHVPVLPQTEGSYPFATRLDEREKMDREELIKTIEHGPVRIHMNNGAVYDIEKPSFALVAELTVAVLYRSEDGKLRNVILPLVTMSAVEPIAA